MSDETKKDGVNLSDTEKKLDQADSIITKTWNILKKHWGKLIVFLLIYGGYKFVVLVGEEMDKPTTAPVEETIKAEDTLVKENVTVEHYVVRAYDELQQDGTYLRILVWSDGVETVDENYKY